jgi:hypothetical protein
LFGLASSVSATYSGDSTATTVAVDAPGLALTLVVTRWDFDRERRLEDAMAPDLEPEHRPTECDGGAVGGLGNVLDDPRQSGCLKQVTYRLVEIRMLGMVTSGC